MLKYIAIQYFRENKGFLKNYGLFYVAFVAIAVLGLAFLVDMGLDPYMYVVQISIVICALGMYYVFLGKYCNLRMHPATFHFTFNTRRFFTAKLISVAGAFFSMMLLSALLILAVNIANLTDIDWLFCASITVFLSSCWLLKWIKYKSDSVMSMIVVFAEFLLSCFSFIMVVMTGDVVYLIAQSLIMVVALVHNCLQKADWGQYLKDITYLAYINHAASEKDMALMQQIVTERIAETKRFIFLCTFPLVKGNAVFYKAVIEAIRVSKVILLIQVALILLGLSIRNFELFSNFAILEIDFGHMLSALFVNSFLIFINQTFCRNLTSIFDKHRRGFNLPYSDTEIIRNYFYAASIVMTLSVIIISAIHQAHLIWLLIAVVGANGLVLLSLYHSYKTKINSRLFSFAIGIAFYAMSVLIV